MILPSVYEPTTQAEEDSLYCEFWINNAQYLEQTDDGKEHLKECRIFMKEYEAFKNKQLEEARKKEEEAIQYMSEIIRTVLLGFDQEHVLRST